MTNTFTPVGEHWRAFASCVLADAARAEERHSPERYRTTIEEMVLSVLC